MKAQIHFYDSDGNDIFKKLADIKHCTGKKIPSLEIMLNRYDESWLSRQDVFNYY